MMAETAQSQVVSTPIDEPSKLNATDHHDGRRSRSLSGPRDRVGPATETNQGHDDLCARASAQLGLVGETGR